MSTKEQFLATIIEKHGSLENAVAYANSNKPKINAVINMTLCILAAVVMGIIYNAIGIF